MSMKTVAWRGRPFRYWPGVARVATPTTPRMTTTTAAPTGMALRPIGEASIQLSPTGPRSRRVSPAHGADRRRRWRTARRRPQQEPADRSRATGDDRAHSAPRAWRRKARSPRPRPPGLVASSAARTSFSRSSDGPLNKSHRECRCPSRLQMPSIGARSSCCMSGREPVGERVVPSAEATHRLAGDVPAMVTAGSASRCPTRCRRRATSRCSRISAPTTHGSKASARNDEQWRRLGTSTPARASRLEMWEGAWVLQAESLHRCLCGTSLAHASLCKL